MQQRRNSTKCLALVFFSLLLGVVPASGQGATDPVGFEIIDFLGDDFTIFGARFLENRVFVGEADSVDGVNLIDFDGDFNLYLDPGTSYLVEIYSGLSENRVVGMATVASSMMITLEEALPLDADVSYAIRIRPRLSDLLDPVSYPDMNQAEGFDPDTGDLVLIANELGEFDRYFYSSEAGGTGYYNARTGEPEDPLLFYPEGLVYLRRGTGYTFVSAGRVKESPTLVTLAAELNYLCPVNPLATLGSSGLGLGLVSGDSSAADLVGLQNASGDIVRYFNSDGSTPGLTAGWRLVDPPPGEENDDQGATSLPSTVTVELTGPGSRNVLLSAP